MGGKKLSSASIVKRPRGHSSLKLTGISTRYLYEVLIPPFVGEGLRDFRQDLSSLSPEETSVCYLILSSLVMRVAMPRLSQQISSHSFSPYAEQSDRAASLASVAMAEMVSVAPHLTLPATARDDLLGEIFSCYISVSNHTEELTSNLVIKAELQSSSRKVTLFDNSEAPAMILEGSQCIDFLGREKLSEVGVHILACSCSYFNKSNERKFFQKFFKFNVTSAFTIESKVLPLRSGFSVQTRLTNATNRPLFLNLLRFLAIDPSQFRVIDANPKTTSNVDIPSLPSVGTALVMRPGDTRQLLYLLERADVSVSPSKEATPLGRIEYTWSTSMGEKGQWATDVLVGPPLIAKAMSLLIENIPPSVLIHEPFTLKLTLKNETEAVLSPSVQINGSTNTSLLVTGASSRKLPEMPPGVSFSFDLSLVAHLHGLHTLSNILVNDPSGAKIIEFNDVIEFYVERSRS